MRLNSTQTDSKATLAQLTQYLQDWVAPRAAEIDQSPAALAEAFAGLGARSLLALSIAPLWGGQGFSSIDYWQAQRCLARYSGSLAFLQTQHQSAANFIAQGSNTALKAAHLPRMAQGLRAMGVGFSHLRRRGKPCLEAVACQGGYVLTGKLPWATGQGYFSHLVVGAALRDGPWPDPSPGGSILAIIPFEDQADLAIACNPPMALAALGVTGTVEMQLRDWFVADDQVIDHKPVDWLAQSDRRNVLKATAFLIGCSEAALDLLQQSSDAAPSQRAWQRLSAAVQAQQQAILTALTKEAAAPFEQQVKLRAEAIALCHRCAQAAVIASGGAANLLGHSAQRIYREALVFTVSGQTRELKAASLAALTLDLP
jgi:alkylation response protein AidB-like acyl-CoA dehydrogenase